MKKVLGIIASPRKLGNTEILVKEISRNIKEEHETKLIRLTELNINTCTACYQCLIQGKDCKLDDDLKLFIDSVSEADALILGVPTYFLGPHSSLKVLLDRGLSFFNKSDRMWGKPSVAFTVSGIAGKDGYSLLGIKSFLKSLMSDIKYTAIFNAAYPGEAMMNGKNHDLIREMSSSLFGTQQKTDSKPICNLCGGDTFRFIDENLIQCSLCSNIGVFKMIDKILIPVIEKDQYELFLSDDAAQEHLAWLKSMKEKFVIEIPKLKMIRDEYRDDWNWIK